MMYSESTVHCESSAASRSDDKLYTAEFGLEFFNGSITTLATDVSL